MGKKDVPRGAGKPRVSRRRKETGERHHEEREERDARAASTTGLFFKEVARWPVLKPKEEFELARRIKAHIAACVRTIAALVGTARRIVKAGTGPFERIRGFKSFASLPRWKRRLEKKTGRARREAIVACARDLLRRFDADPGEDPRGRIAAMVADSGCAAYLAEFVSEEAKRDFDRMVNCNLRLVIALAKRFHGLPFPDLVQEGNIGLVKAVSKFDPDRGFRFSTYASWWIKHAMSRAVADIGREIRVPVHALDFQHKLGKTQKRLLGELGRMPTPKELAKSLGVEIEKVRRMDIVPTRSISLDQPTRPDDETTTLGKFLIIDEHDASHPVGTIAAAEDGRLIREAIAGLKPLEREIILRRFGLLEAESEETLAEIAKDHDLSRERIRQIQSVALKKMRRAFERHER